MHSLCDLKKLFENSGIEIEHFSGWQIITVEHGTWSMVFDEYYRNRELISRDDIKKYLKKS